MNPMLRRWALALIAALLLIAATRIALAHPTHPEPAGCHQPDCQKGGRK